MTNKMNKWMKKKWSSLKNEFGNVCWYCGKIGNFYWCNGQFIDDLEFAHLKKTELNGMSRGRKERYYDIVRNKDAYALLHKDHHEMFDDGLISLSEIMDGKDVYVIKNVS